MSGPPSRLALLAEGRVAAEWLAGRIAWRRIAAARAGQGAGRGVMVIPGFLADDHLTVMLRHTLSAAGYRTRGWELGQNRGITPGVLERMLDLLDRQADAAGPLALVGWSLGGLYARELAKHRPGRVERVVTLGSPFSGDLRWTNAWRLYERVNGHPIGTPPISVVLHEKPPVPTIALWSSGDGIVAPAAARGLAGERDVAVRVAASHMGLVCAPAALRAVLDAMALPIDGQERRLNDPDEPPIGAPLGFADPPSPKGMTGSGAPSGSSSAW